MSKGIIPDSVAAELQTMQGALGLIDGNTLADHEDMPRIWNRLIRAREMIQEALSADGREVLHGGSPG